LPLPFEYTDSDNDSEMAEERTIATIQFKGLANDDAEQWMKHFENYCAYKNYDDPKKLALCNLYVLLCIIMCLLLLSVLSFMYFARLILLVFNNIVFLLRILLIISNFINVEY